jgi:hypothetical protein
MKLRSYTPSATQGAINAVAAFGRARTTSTARISPMSCGTYDCHELAPCQDRPSAMQASALPSRRGENLLRWPDGRLTDLHGAPVQPPESHYTAPTFTQPSGMPAAPLRPISTPAAPVNTRFTTDGTTRKTRHSQQTMCSIFAACMRVGLIAQPSPAATASAKPR